MGRKIFISYKYADDKVRYLRRSGYEDTTVRHYVDELQDILSEDHIYKGEDDGNDLSHLKDDTIWSNLKEKIFDSSITLVLLSKNMRDHLKTESEQWIPSEIAYSLKEMTRGDRTSYSNGILVVVLPDENSSYDYAVEHSQCVTTWKTDSFFPILAKNMFNRKSKNTKICSTCISSHHTGYDHSYAYPVKWDDFLENIDVYINHVSDLKNSISDFNIQKALQ